MYEDNLWEETLKLVDNTSDYALTGAVFSQDRYALQEAFDALENSAGNFILMINPPVQWLDNNPLAVKGIGDK